MKPLSPLGISLVSLLLAPITPAVAIPASEWRSQSIYQVLTDRFALPPNSPPSSCPPAAQAYCGGTWRGLTSKLDYIQGMGFTAIWISPFTAQVEGGSGDGEAYHGYWAEDIWRVNERFGTEEDLKSLMAECRRRGVKVMADLVVNHLAYRGCRNCVDYGRLKPWGKKEFFHDPCGIDYSNQTSVEICWQGSDRVSLPDLKTERDDVRADWADWVRQMQGKYGFDGFRLDSAKHTETSFWAPFRAAAGDTYLLGEVFSGDPSYVTPYQNVLDGILDYPSYYWITRAFRSSTGNIPELSRGINTIKNTARDTSLLGSFLENHDIERFGFWTSDLARTKNAVAFTMLKDGIPVIYQGQEQRFNGGATPMNREAQWLAGYDTSSEMYKFIGRVNRMRSWAANQDGEYLTWRALPVYEDGNTIVLRKGSVGRQVVGVYSNLGEGGTAVLTFGGEKTGFGAGEVVVDVLSCEMDVVRGDGSLRVVVLKGEPRVFYLLERLRGSGICPGLEGEQTTMVTSTTVAMTTKVGTTPTASLVPGCSETAVPVTFEVLASTVWGETIKLTGSHPFLSSWSPTAALPLSSSRYTPSTPVWWISVLLPPQTTISYKFIRVSNTGTVTWQGGGDRVVQIACPAPWGNGMQVVSGTW